MNVYVNVTYDCSSQSKYWKTLSQMNVYVNVTYMTVVLKGNIENLESDEFLFKCYIWL